MELCEGAKNQGNKIDIDDRISELSDDILTNIISRLTMREAVRTCILSSRWRYLWKCFNGCLDFDDPLTMADLACGPEWKMIMDLGNEWLDVESNKFVSWVNYVLSSFQSQTFEGLRICFDVTSNKDICNWIKFAIVKRVQRLELDFSRVNFSPADEIVQYTFPSHVDCPSNFRSLTVLRLARMDVTVEVIENLLCCCPFLEVLSIKHSECVKDTLKVSGPSLRLKCLELRHLENVSLVIIDAANLVSFEFSGYHANVFFENVPSLVELSLNGCRWYHILSTLNQYSCSLLQLQTLKLEIYNEVVVPYGIPILCNLKHLEMTIDVRDEDHLLPCAAFLKASPSLYKFTLKIKWKCHSSGLVWTVKDHPYLSPRDLSIRVVELYGFVGLTADVKFLICLIENAKQLEKIVVDPCKPTYLGTAKEFWDRESKEYQSARERAIQLAAKFPLQEFVIP